jgi:glutamyl-tRNA synthetase
LPDFVERADFFFLDDFPLDREAREKFLSKDLSAEFSLFIERLKKLEPFDIAAVESAFRELVQELAIQSKVLIHPVRVALTGKTVGPGLFEVIYYLGRERTIARLERWIKGETGVEFLFLVSGCETVKGAADGAQKDLHNAKKTDEWMRDNLW